jgi:hypothetical protein
VESKVVRLFELFFYLPGGCVCVLGCVGVGYSLHNSMFVCIVKIKSYFM